MNKKQIELIKKYNITAICTVHDFKDSNVIGHPTRICAKCGMPENEWNETLQVEENKLTNDEIARVFAMYLGKECVVVLEKSAAEFHGTPYSAPMKIVSETLRGLYISESNPGKSDFKLLLTPLSEITDEHAIELINLTKLVHAINPKLIEHRDKRLLQYWDGVAGNEVTIMWNDLNAVQHQYLISKGYAVPLWFGINHWANGKTAIELNIAIPHHSNGK